MWEGIENFGETGKVVESLIGMGGDWGERDWRQRVWLSLLRSFSTWREKRQVVAGGEMGHVFIEM